MNSIGPCMNAIRLSSGRKSSNTFAATSIAYGRQRPCKGRTHSEAFVVTCDQSTMTTEDILHGRVICLVGVALVTPGEFTYYRIHIQQKSW